MELQIFEGYLDDLNIGCRVRPQTVWMVRSDFLLDRIFQSARQLWGEDVVEPLTSANNISGMERSLIIIIREATSTSSATQPDEARDEPR